MDAERLHLRADQADLLAGGDPAERRRAGARQHQPGVARQITGGVQVDDTLRVEPRQVAGADRQLGHPGPAGVGDQLVAVLVGLQAHRRGLDPQRDVLGDQGDVGPLGLVVDRDGQDP
ncbi:hypothetical protein SDC9_194866 [bioreactor metagenome]|uniref:Uncharacterized protein n=1 Tax=bioreactor metagenome TaxID=1076179 RepID=A0A645IG41_9ZZZZ